MFEIPVQPCCGGPQVPADAALPSADQPFVTGTHSTPVGDVPAVSSSLTRADHLGSLRVRLGAGRATYKVEPGLYALGAPGPDDPVLVSANYKLSFDHLRSHLPGRSAWILVLDTRGINVWCAAGKGTFGTEEVVRRVQGAGLVGLVRHRQLVLPQLGAPGVAGHAVRQATGFKVKWGPVMAADLPAWLDAGGKATAAMRRKRFPLRERAVLIPVELNQSLRTGVWLAPLIFVLAALGWGDGFSVSHGILALGWLAAGLVGGAILTPLLLPWLPLRAFAAKGTLAGALTAGVLVLATAPRLATWDGRAEVLGGAAIAVALAAFLGMNFTGSSTYTSLSGVRREMRVAVPLQVAVAALGLIAVTASRWLA